MVIDISAPLTLKALGDHLWQSEGLFRNKISNQKDYVLALLFFKRACDRYAEETAADIEDLDGIPGALEIIEANPSAYHAILIPETCFWHDVRDTDTGELGKGTASPTATASSPSSTTTTGASTDAWPWPWCRTRLRPLGSTSIGP